MKQGHLENWAGHTSGPALVEINNNKNCLIVSNVENEQQIMPEELFRQTI
jgi:hypothetical protein